MNNITEIRSELCKVFAALRDGSMEPKEAVEINNMAGKLISTCKVELAYHALRISAPDRMPVIDFLEGEPTIPTIEVQATPKLQAA